MNYLHTRIIKMQTNKKCDNILKQRILKQSSLNKKTEVEVCRVFAKNTNAVIGLLSQDSFVVSLFTRWNYS